MRWIAPILFLGIVFNSLCLLVFRIKLDRRSAKDFQLLSNDLQSRISSFSDSALRSIDLYFVSNYHARVSSDISVVGASRVPSSEYFAEDCGEWDYHYSRIDGFSCAMVGTQVFRVGDPFPRGGRISSIYPDSIVVNGEYFFRNRSYRGIFASSVVPVDSIRPDVPKYEPPKEIDKYVK